MLIFWFYHITGLLLFRFNISYRCILGPLKRLWWKFLVKIVNGCLPFTIFAKSFYNDPSKWPYIPQWNFAVLILLFHTRTIHANLREKKFHSFHGVQSCVTIVETSQCERYVKSKYTRMMSITSFWCLYCYLWIYIRHCASASIVHFQQVHAGLDQHTKYQ